MIAPVLDPARARLRATVAKLEREVKRLSTMGISDPGNPAFDALSASLADLVEQLALGPEPEVRQCPVCGHVGMRDATLCGYCWTRFSPPTGELR